MSILNTPQRIFISHRHLNLKLIQVFQVVLENMGHDVIVYYKQPPPDGNTIMKEIESHVQEADMVLIASSTEARVSFWVKLEHLFGSHYDIPLYYIEIDPCKKFSNNDLQACVRRTLQNIAPLTAQHFVNFEFGEWTRRHANPQFSDIDGEKILQTDLKNVKFDQAYQLATSLFQGEPSIDDLWMIARSDHKTATGVRAFLRTFASDKTLHPKLRLYSNSLLTRLEIMRDDIHGIDIYTRRHYLDRSVGELTLDEVTPEGLEFIERVIEASEKERVERDNTRSWLPDIEVALQSKDLKVMQMNMTKLVNKMQSENDEANFRKALSNYWKYTGITYGSPYENTQLMYQLQVIIASLHHLGSVVPSEVTCNERIDEGLDHIWRVADGKDLLVQTIRYYLRQCGFTYVIQVLKAIREQFSNSTTQPITKRLRYIHGTVMVVVSQYIYDEGQFKN